MTIIKNMTGEVVIVCNPDEPGTAQVYHPERYGFDVDMIDVRSWPQMAAQLPALDNADYTGLPGDIRPGWYIVPEIVAMAVPRADFVHPDSPVRYRDDDLAYERLVPAVVRNEPDQPADDARSA